MFLASIVAAIALQAPITPSPNPGVEDAAPFQLEEIVVEGTRLEVLTRRFVEEVSAPARGRGLARWRDGVCVGVVNLRVSVAQPIVDRVSGVAGELGLRVGEPGCRPNVVIIATDDGGLAARALIEREPRLFRPGGSGMDRGGDALERFRSSNDAVRWWHVSAPTDANTGQIAVRMPGFRDPNHSHEKDHSFLFAPFVKVLPSLLSEPLRDDLRNVFIIVDVDDIQPASTEALADYLAMVALAQIDPEASTAAYHSVLNLFDDAEAAPGLTGWDRAYLQGLYDGESRRVSQASQVQSVANAILHNYRDGLGETD